MDSCLHQSSAEKDWLPSSNGLLGKHPFCQNCGVVKVVSSDRGKDVGYFINSLSELRKFLERKGYKISKAQIRLIIKEFEEGDLNDTYSTPFSQQKEVFIDLVKRYINVSRDLVRSFV